MIRSVGWISVVDCCLSRPTKWAASSAAISSLSVTEQILRPLSALATAGLIAKRVLPTPCRPRNARCSLRSMNQISRSESICSRRIEGWEVKPNTDQRLTLSRRHTHTTVASRWQLLGAIWATSGHLIVSPAVNPPLSIPARIPSCARGVSSYAESSRAIDHLGEF